MQAKSRYPMPIPFGWFVVGYSSELASGEAKPLQYFGKDLVMFRGESGKAIILDAYCPHLGAHLGYGIHEQGESGQGGRVEGDTITCPFHAWRFNASGECVEIPYAKNIPPKIVNKQCLKPWPTREFNQVIYVWYHPEDADPMWEVVTHEELSDDDWGELDCSEWTINTHMQEMAENGADPAHFLYVHRTATMPKWDINYKDHTSTAVQDVHFNTPKGKATGQILSRAWGPGQTTTRFTGICETLLMGMITPIDNERLHVRFAFVQKKDDQSTGVGIAIKEDIRGQMLEDKPIWEHKIYRSLPMLCDGDGPVSKFRKWYSQFYFDFNSQAL